VRTRCASARGAHTHALLGGRSTGTLDIMFPPLRRPRLPLRAALRAYWPWFSGLVFSSALLSFWPGAVSHFQLVAIVFLASALMAGWPWLFRDAPYSFWIVGCVGWFLSPVVFAVVAVLVTTVKGSITK
jgi:hypothetical protein